MSEMLPFVSRFGELSEGGRSLTRWSARVLTTSFLLADLAPNIAPPANLFDSLANQLRDAAICAARVPRWLSIAALIMAFRLIVGGLWSAVGQAFFGIPQQGNVLDMRRSLVANRMMIHSIWRAPDFRPLRRKLIWGAFVFSILSGVLSVSFAAWVLPMMSSFWSWALIVVVSFAVSQVEKSRTERLYASHTPRPKPPGQAEAVRRLAAYTLEHPLEVTTASPLLYAYSALDRQQLGQRFLKLGMGGVSLAPRLVALALVAAIYPHVPAPDIESLGQAGFLGCTYTDLYGFFRLTQENLPLSVAAAAVLLAITPLTVLSAYILFMIEWRFPVQVQFEVLRREWGFAKRMMVYQPVIAAGGAIFGMISLWVSAWLATRLHSPIAGLFVLVVVSLAATVAFQKRIVAGLK